MLKQLVDQWRSEADELYQLMINEPTYFSHLTEEQKIEHRDRSARYSILMKCSAELEEYIRRNGVGN